VEAEHAAQANGARLGITLRFVFDEICKKSENRVL
jgi:hypothetical protein